MNLKQILTSILLFFSSSAIAGLSLPELFSNHMMLQRGIEIPVWGNASPGARIEVRLNSFTANTQADKFGKWTLHLPVQQAGGPYQLVITASDKETAKIIIEDVLIGDVWLASGQSNMELKVAEANNAKVEIKQADFEQIRFFNVPHRKSFKPENNIPGGKWLKCDSLSVAELSAVAYYFGRKIHQDVGVPVGIVQSTWGGTPVEAWTSREMLLASDITRERTLNNDTVNEHHFLKDSTDLIRFWDIVYRPQNKTDKTVPKFAYNDADWLQLNMPSTVSTWNFAPYEGILWLRKSLNLDAGFVGKDLTINLGHPDMNYSLYFNGQEICKTVWNANLTHHYTIPAKFVKAGKNVVAVRMSVLWGGGGFNPPASELYLTNGNDTLTLAGSWKYKTGLEPAVPPIRNYQYYPAMLYNAMIHPVVPFALRGFIWYQGEANDTAACHYRKLFPAMIADWRIRWKQAYLPFLYVQLPNYKKRLSEPIEQSNWADMREAQTMALFQPNTGMACTIDLGEADNIHPRNKQEVGYRLALIAEKQVYGHDVAATGPVMVGYKIEGSTIRLTFDQLLAPSDGKLPTGFAVAGSDKKFCFADAKIEGKDLVVFASGVYTPAFVKYAWADNPDCNLTNSCGIPAYPFRTDEWKSDCSCK